MRRIASPTLRAMLLAATTLAAAGCAGHQNSAMLTETEQHFTQARNDPAITEYAPTQLREAEQSLTAARQAALTGAPDVDHLAYLADKKLDIARTSAEQQAALAQRQTLLSRSGQVQAEQRAQTAQLQASNAEQRAASAERQVRQLAAQVQAAKARETAEGTVLTFTDLLFQPGDAKLQPGSELRLGPLAEYMRQHPDRTVVVQGHTDTTGDPDNNLALSRRRAEAVRDYLVSQGVAPERVIARGYGEEFPIASNQTPAGRQENRRVEVVIAPPPQVGEASPPPAR